MTSYDFSIEEIDHLYQKFRKYDKNKDRVLSRSEIWQLLKDEIVSISDKDVQWFCDITEIGTNDKGELNITFPQFVRGVSEFGKRGAKIEFQSKKGLPQASASTSLVASGNLVIPGLVRGVTWQEVDRIFKQFTRADTNNSGTISLPEMTVVFEKVVPDLPPKDYPTVFKQIDINKSGYVDFLEFLRWIEASATKISLGTHRSRSLQRTTKFNKLETSLEKTVKLKSKLYSGKQKSQKLDEILCADAFKAFKVMDADDNGLLSEAEFTAALTQVLGNLTGSEKNRLYHVVDSDHSGSISIDEFLFAVATEANVMKLTKNMKNAYNPNKFDWEIPYDELEVGPIIGEGNFGIVYKGKWHGTPVAIKKLRGQTINAEILEDFKKEVTILAKLRHPNMVLFMGACTVGPHLCIVTEFLGEGSVYSLLHQRKPTKKLTTQGLVHIATQTARGLNYLHQTGIVHRDLKSLNLLMDENHVCKVCDFGLSCVKPKPNEPSLRDQVGTPLWMAPEVLINNNYTEKVDVYSFGMCLWEMVTNTLPFADLNYRDLVKAVAHDKKRPEIPLTCPPPIANLIRQCWDASPDKRPTFGEIIVFLEQLARK